jgi:molybdopterin-guanine dinucleotide biosynthesis protein A
MTKRKKGKAEKMTEIERKKAIDTIRKIDNVIYNLKLTFKEIDQLQSWLSNIETKEEIEEAILERVIIALEEAKKTRDSV